MNLKLDKKKKLIILKIFIKDHTSLIPFSFISYVPWKILYTFLSESHDMYVFQFFFKYLLTVIQKTYSIYFSTLPILNVKFLYLFCYYCSLLELNTIKFFFNINYIHILVDSILRNILSCSFKTLYQFNYYHSYPYSVSLNKPILLYVLFL